MSKECKTLEDVKVAEQQVKQKYKELGELSYELTRKKETLTSEHIIKNKLLSKVQWTCWIASSGNILLEGSYDAELIALADANHCNVPITDSIRIRFDDGDMCLVFDNQSMIKDFIDQNNLNVSVDSRKIDSLRKQKKDIDIKISEYEKIVKSVMVTQKGANK